MIEAKFNTVGDVESMLNMVGGTTIDHEVASGSLLHIMPYVPHDRSDEEETITQTRKRSAGDAEIPMRLLRLRTNRGTQGGVCEDSVCLGVRLRSRSRLSNVSHSYS